MRLELNFIAFRKPRFYRDGDITDGFSDENRIENDDPGDEYDQEYKITLPVSVVNRVQNYSQSLSQSSSEFNDQKTDSWSYLYKRKGLFNQLSETSSSALNEVLEESSSVSGQRFSLFDTPESVHSNVASSPPSCGDKFASIPMICEDDSQANYSTSCLDKKDSEFEAVAEVFEDERRHSDPWNRISSELPASSSDIIETNNNSSSYPEEKRKEQSLSPVIYTIRLTRNRFGKTWNASECQKYQSPENSCQLDASVARVNDNLKPRKSNHSMLSSCDQLNSFPDCKSSFKDIEIAAQQVMDFLDAPSQFSDTQATGLERQEQYSSEAVDSTGFGSSSHSKKLSYRNLVGFPTAKSASVSDVRGKDTPFPGKSSGKSSLVDKMSSLIRRSSSRSDCDQKDLMNSSALGQLCKQSLSFIHPPVVGLVNNSVDKLQPNTFSFSVNDQSSAHERSHEKSGQTDKLSFFGIFKFK